MRDPKAGSMMIEDVGQGFLPTHGEIRWGRHSCPPRQDVLVEPNLLESSGAGVPPGADTNVYPTNSWIPRPFVHNSFQPIGIPDLLINSPDQRPIVFERRRDKPGL